MDVDVFLGDAYGSAGLDDLPAEFLGLRISETVQLVRQPAIAPVGHHGQGRIQIRVERNFACQAVEMEEVDATSQRILDPIAPSVPCDDPPSGFIKVVAQKERGFVASQTGGCDLSQFSPVIGYANGLLKVSDVLMSAFRIIDHSTPPCGIRLVGKTAEDSTTPASNGDERCLAARIEPTHLGVRR